MVNALQRVLRAMEENDLFAEPRISGMLEREGFAFDLEKLEDPDDEATKDLENWVGQLEQNFGELEFDAEKLWGSEKDPAGSALVLAWYQPLTYHRANAGIYITDFGIWYYMRLISTVQSHYNPPLFTWPVLPLRQKVWLSIELLLQHELFHHDVESFAIRLNSIHNAKRLYEDYDNFVYRITDPIEEALATAKMQLGIQSKVNKIRLGQQAKFYAEILANNVPSLPGYRDANLYNSAARHAAGRRVLASSINQVTAFPKTLHAGASVAISKGMLSEYFRENFILVPMRGKHGVTAPPTSMTYTISARSIERLLIKLGYWDSGLGNGSHTVWKHKNRPAVTLTSGKEYEGNGVLKNLKNSLGFKSLDDLKQAAREA